MTIGEALRHAMSAPVGTPINGEFMHEAFKLQDKTGYGTVRSMSEAVAIAFIRDDNSGR